MKIINTNIKNVFTFTVMMFWISTLFAQQVLPDLSGKQTGLVYFESLTPKSYYALLRQADKLPKTPISGTLSFPSNYDGTSKIPAIVISHGSGGIMSNATDRWQPLFLKLGMAVFIVDSYGPRGVKDTVSNQGQLSFGASLADAFSALKFLATDPRIDANRIGEIGFSRGGTIAIHTMLEKFRVAVIPDASTKFAAHIALYPACSYTYWGEKNVFTGAPIMLAIGGNDDYVSPKLCTNYAQKLKSVIPKVDVKVYAGAFHDFDAFDGKSHWIRGAVSDVKCPGVEIDIESLKATDMGTGKQYKGWDEYAAAVPDCLTKGGTIAGNSSVAKQAEADVQEFLSEAFRLTP